MVLTIPPKKSLGRLRLWDAATGGRLYSDKHFLGIDTFSVNPFSSLVAFNSDGTKLLGKNWRDNEAQIWDIASGKSHVTFEGHDDKIREVCFSPDDRLVVTAAADRTARIWDAATGKEMVVIRGQEGGFSRVLFSPDGERVLTASDDGTVKLWPADPLAAAKRLKSRELTSGERIKYNLR
jgi:WD40 repeat protein